MAKTYNINAMRPALLEARKQGNKKIITKQFCEGLGISAGYFDSYKNTIKELFEAVAHYCRLKNSPNTDREKPDELKKAYEAIYPLWKTLLETGEKEKMKKDLHVGEEDIANLIGFCQKFVADSNDVSRGKDEDFVAQKVWANQPLAQFQKAIETDLGIRIAKIEVLSDEERDFLRAENKILRSWKAAESRIGTLTVRKENFTKELKSAKGDELKKYIEEHIKTIDEKIAEQQKKVKDCEKEFNKLHNPEKEDVEAEKAETKKTTKAKKTTKKSKKAA